MSTNTPTVCKYCCSPEDKQNTPCFKCLHCNELVHLKCLQGALPSPLAGDVFFDFTCADCSRSGQEVFVRGKMTWVNALILTLNQLKISSTGISNCGFFHYKSHISWFINRNWKILFGSQFKQKKNWIGTLVGALSNYSGVLFQSSTSVLGEPGCWRLMHQFSPALLEQIMQEMALDKANKVKARKTEGDQPAKTFLEIVCGHGYEHLLYEDGQQINENTCEIPSKRRKTYDDDNSTAHQHQSFDDLDSDNSHDTALGKPTTKQVQELKSEAGAYQKPEEDLVLPSANLGFRYPGQLEPTYDSDSRSQSPPVQTSHHTAQLYESDGWNLAAEDKPKTNEHKNETSVEPNLTSLFSKEPNSINVLPWLRPIEQPDKSLVRLTEYEEIQLLKQVEILIPDVANPVDKNHLRRFRAKLALRRLKRNRHLPLFDLDQTVKYLGGYSNEDPCARASSKERVLDRFQASFLCGSTAESVPTTFLVGHTDFASFQSPYSGAILKPFIRRDTESSPLWLRLMDELIQRTKCKNPDYVQKPRAPIDYSYVKPQHIAAVNNLCAQFFWPGVDLTEALQYPEFSCVATYRKLLVGFAFLVPDAGRSTAYISFVLTRPEWRKSKIATFMLYHLLQTCTGKDVTLHVSPTNPAIFLYQKFGFKVEELVQDFYEKYFDIDSKDCKHALFLRLTR